jgi:hypothetical protein
MMHVAHCRLNVGVAHPRLDRRDLGSPGRQRSERVTQVMETQLTQDSAA